MAEAVARDAGRASTVPWRMTRAPVKVLAPVRRRVSQPVLLRETARETVSPSTVTVWAAPAPEMTPAKSRPAAEAAAWAASATDTTPSASRSTR